MTAQAQHALLPRPTHDESSRENFCASLRRFFTEDLFPANARLYTDDLVPRYTAATGHAPASVRDIRAIMNESSYYRCSSLVGRAAQELMWDTVGEGVERQLDTLIENAAPKPGDLGTLRLNPDLKMPKYIEGIDIHVMPGNFQTELTDNDVYAGALYDRGVHVFTYGGLGDRNQAMGDSVAKFLKEKFPDFKPRRILDIGCGVGHSTLPLKEAYPDAEVHGVDVGAPMVRYAHGRAESLGLAIHYSQQDGTATDFPDGHFDLVVSAIVIHEMPRPAIRAMFRECHRLLRTGGVMIHDATLPPPEPFDEFMTTWFTYNNNESFSTTGDDSYIDYTAEFAAGGFDTDKVYSGTTSMVFLKQTLPNIAYTGAVKS